MKTSVVAGKKLKKSDAYKLLATYINRHTNSDWNEKQAKGRYETYLSMYKKVKRDSLNNGNTLRAASSRSGKSVVVLLDPRVPRFPLPFSILILNPLVPGFQIFIYSRQEYDLIDLLK